MLCSSCRRQLSRDTEFCGTCGTPRPGATQPLELVLPDRTRVPVVGEITIGRAAGSTLVLDDPSVSRMHARIVAETGTPMIEDAGSSHGTFVDGHQVSSPVTLRDGARISVGNATLDVQRRRDDAEAGRTIVVQPGASLMISAVGQAGDVSKQTTQFGTRPRLRSGYALKKLDASEGSKRYVLRDLRNDQFLRLSERDAEIMELLDGEHSLIDLIGIAEQRHGGAGAARVARLLADLSERGFLAGIASGQAMAEDDAPTGLLRRLFKKREKVIPGLGDKFESIYRHGAWVLFTRPALILIGVLIAAGLGAFGYLIAGRYGTPFVVASKIGIGGLVFFGGRLAVVVVHEMAHGLTMASFGRRVDRAGFKFIGPLPFAFVDTSEAWFEPRNRRVAISAAGPISDFSVGAIFALCSLLFAAGTVRDIFFNLAFAGYVGAFFNLNPFLDRDGYHMLVDALREPGLRKRAKDQFERRLSGGGRETDNPVLGRYSLFGVGWSVVMAGFVIFMSRRYEPILSGLVGELPVKVVLYTFWILAFVPVIVVFAKPLRARFRGAQPAT